MRGRFVLWAAVSTLYCIGSWFVSGQDEPVTVPNVTGLTIPQAAAQLNKAGLEFGREIAVSIRDGLTANVISGQSVTSGQPAVAGTVVDVEIPRTSNIRLLYDDNDLTVINLGNANIPLGDLTFETAEGSRNASFNARRWANELRTQQCVQIWSLNRNGPKSLPECRFIQNWIATTDPAQHFWTAVSGVQTFRIVQNDVERATCQAAPANSQNLPVSCEFYLPAGTQDDVTSYIYVAYEDDRLVILNNSDSQWMPVNNTRIVTTIENPEPLGREFRLNAALFGRPDIVARINRLAPNQCLLFVSSEADPTGLLACDVIATMTLAPSQSWWTANFEVWGSDDKRRTCNAATRRTLTLCVMPR